MALADAFDRLLLTEMKKKEMRLAEFDEKWYLATYADVATEVEAGRVKSGRTHYIRYGFREGRLPFPAAVSQKNVELLQFTDSGCALIVSWIKDNGNVLTKVQLQRLTSFDTLQRQRRDDVAKLLNESPIRNHGVWGFLGPGRVPASYISNNSEQALSWIFTDGRKEPSSFKILQVSDQEMRTNVLSMVAQSAHYGALPAGIMHSLSAGTGEEILKLNRMMLAQRGTPAVSRFNTGRRPARRSQITCLYGAPELLKLQIALFSQSQRFAETEFVFVNNSPENSEILERDARQAARLYDTPITLVHTGDNLGFALANNVGIDYATTDRLMFVNPDVLPKDRDWAVKHDDFAASEHGDLFGACLYYDDGSVMHAGMYFESDPAHDGAHTAELLRVEHYAKGFPDWIEQVTKTRAVPAVTGAFISAKRGHFEKLGGFDADYIFGHYEDADLCLKSAAAGTPAWYCADIRLWHMEGKGSAPRNNAHHGASLLNRWLFSDRWATKLRDNPSLARASDN